MTSLRRRLLDDTIKKTVTGKSITVNDSLARMRPGINVYGKSSQVTTTGAQLFDAQKVGALGPGAYGLTISIDGEIIKIQGTVTRITDTNALAFKIFDYPENFYENNTISMDFIDNTGVFGYCYVYSSSNNNDLAIAFETSLDAEVNIVFRLMINAGSTPKPWEPYTGGKPSPSPDYPQQIITAGSSGSIHVSVSGNSKNLCPVNHLEVSVSQSVNISLPAGTYTISGDVESTDTDDDYCTILFTYSDGTTKESGISRGVGVSTTVTLEKDVTRARFYAGISHSLSSGDTATFKNLQIESGSQATEYAPYQPTQTLTVQTPNGLPSIPVNSNGNYIDETGQWWVCDEVDFKRGVYVQRVGKTVADGTNVKFNIGTSDVWWNLPGGSSPGVSTTDVTVMSKYFRDHLGVNSNYDFAFIYNKNGVLAYPQFATVDDLNAFCVEKYTEGDPVIFYYAMDPIETPLSEEELAAYRNIRTYSPSTVLTNDADAGMKLTYKTRKSLEVTE